MLKTKRYLFSIYPRFIPDLFPSYSWNIQEVLIFIRDYFKVYSQFIPNLLSLLDNGKVLQFPATPLKSIIAKKTSR